MISKRVFDLAVVAVSAIVWVPVLALASLAVLVCSGRPVYYRSVRRVSSGREIRLVKFRAMVRNADKIVNRETVPVTNTRFLNVPPGSPLYTGIGRVIERLGLTEIPQLAHVLRGQMSLVGNRPLPENVMACLRAEYPYADDRFLSPSGLTGPAQLVGREALTDAERLAVESAYCRAAAQHYRASLDLKILIYTVLIVFHLKDSFSYDEVMEMVAGGRLKAPVQVRSAGARVHTGEAEAEGEAVEAVG